MSLGATITLALLVGSVTDQVTDDIQYPEQLNTVVSARVVNNFITWVAPEHLGGWSANGVYHARRLNALGENDLALKMLDAYEPHIELIEARSARNDADIRKQQMRRVALENRLWALEMKGDYDEVARLSKENDMDMPARPILNCARRSSPVSLTRALESLRKQAQTEPYVRAQQAWEFQGSSDFSFSNYFPTTDTVEGNPDDVRRQREQQEKSPEKKFADGVSALANSFRIHRQWSGLFDLMSRFLDEEQATNAIASLTDTSSFVFDQDFIDAVKSQRRLLSTGALSIIAMQHPADGLQDLALSRLLTGPTNQTVEAVAAWQSAVLIFLNPMQSKLEKEFRTSAFKRLWPDLLKAMSRPDGMREGRGETNFLSLLIEHKHFQGALQLARRSEQMGMTGEGTSTKYGMNLEPVMLVMLYTLGGEITSANRVIQGFENDNNYGVMFMALLARGDYDAAAKLHLDQYEGRPTEAGEYMMGMYYWIPLGISPLSLKWFADHLMENHEHLGFPDEEWEKYKIRSPLFIRTPEELEGYLKTASYTASDMGYFFVMGDMESAKRVAEAAIKKSGGLDVIRMLASDDRFDLPVEVPGAAELKPILEAAVSSPVRGRIIQEGRPTTHESLMVKQLLRLYLRSETDEDREVCAGLITTVMKPLTIEHRKMIGAEEMRSLFSPSRGSVPSVEDQEAVCELMERLTIN